MAVNGTEVHPSALSLKKLILQRVFQPYSTDYLQFVEFVDYNTVLSTNQTFSLITSLKTATRWRQTSVSDFELLRNGWFPTWFPTL